MADPRHEPGADDLRLFVGLRLSRSTIEALGRAVQTMSAGSTRRGRRPRGARIRWASPTVYHVTLKFLGLVGRGGVEDVRAVLVECAQTVPGAVSFTTRGLGAFPSRDEARVVWAGIDEPTGRLPRIAAVLDEGMAGLGIEREQRPYRPHVTLARLGRPSDVSGLLSGVMDQDFNRTSAGSLVLFQSVMRATGGPEYLSLAEIPLDAA